MTRRRVVSVGVPATEAGPLAWAVAEAAVRDATLEVVAANDRDPAIALIEAALGADLLIVGASNQAIARGRLFGSAPSGAARRTSCPVVAVRGRQRHPLRRIVVGVDGSNASAAALDWAVDEANLHDADLVVVHAWRCPLGGRRWTRRDVLDRSDAQCRLDLAIRHCEKRSDRVVGSELIEGEAAGVLTTASTNADLIAVGSRGPSGFTTMAFGSVALFVADHSACPVAVIHPRVWDRSL